MMHMKTSLLFFALVAVMASIALSSCSCNSGMGDTRDRNIEKAALARLDSIPGVEYVGLSDTRILDDGDFEAVIIYYIPDSLGGREERNARVVTSHNGAEILSWQDLDTRILDDVKHKVTDKLQEKGINIDDSLIDALIELKRR